MRTYSLSEVAEIALPPDWKNPERWLRERLNRGQLKGYKLGRVWRMRQDHLDYLTESRNNTPQPEIVDESAPVSILAGLTPRAQARIQRDQTRRLA